MNIPKEIQEITNKLRKNGFEAYLVGGCVRDEILGKIPSDWDIATNVKPEEIIKIFPRNFYNNKFGTVTVQTNSDNPSLTNVEITPYRTEESYSDKRHPDKVIWTTKIEDDLKRRDFTINAIAYNEDKKTFVDPFNGQEDAKQEKIKAVGKPNERFSEDPLRIMRAVRLAASLSGNLWQIEEKTKEAIKKNASKISEVSAERIRDEFVKTIMSPLGARGVEIMRRLNILSQIIPEIEEGFGVEQNKHHIYQIYEHNLLSLNYACENNYSREVRIAALLHDVGKTKTKRGKGRNSTFYNHEVVGANMTKKILERLKFPRKEIIKITKLVRYHLFYYDVEEVGESSVRRLLRRIGRESVEELMQVRYCDRIGSGVPKAEPYKLRHLKYLFEKVSRDPISPKMLKISGDDIMKLLNIPPGPKVGKILTCLLSEILKEPRKNSRTELKKQILLLGQEMSEQELNRTFNRTRKEIESIRTKKDQMTKKKYWLS